MSDALKPNELTVLLKQRIANYAETIQSKDNGRVISVMDGIVLIQRLKDAMSSELLEFENGAHAMVMNLESDHVGAVILDDTNGISEGDMVYRTKSVVRVPVGNGLLGRVVDPLGNPLDGGSTIEHDGYAPIEKVAPGVMKRQSVNEPLMTGIKVVDTMLPIGKGQRELIIGDRQTGKSALAIDTIINQKDKNVKCIYVAIGQKASTVASVVEKLKETDALRYTVIVNASAATSATLQYIAPYAGCAMGEYWMDQGEHVLIVYDDLSKHAVAYRTLSLLLRRPPGREAYPGDVFYLHSRLLERAAKLNDANGGGSLTALPIIETQAGDISAYIPTNVISITDGQIFLQTDLFNGGIRPAVDTGLSVSRVGSAAQSKAMKRVSSSLKMDLAQFHELESFTQFGSDLDEATSKTINKGRIITQLLIQRQYAPFDMSEQVVVFYGLNHGYFDDIPLEKINDAQSMLLRCFHEVHGDLLQQIDQQGVLSDELNTQLDQAIDAIKIQWNTRSGV